MNKVHEIKLALAACFSAAAAALGWKGIMVLTWVTLMALDYLTGSAAAMKSGHWNSSRAREGIWHKGGAIIVAIVAAIADGIMVVICGNIPVLNMQWPSVLLPLILAWYTLTELGSILENAVALGANPPVWLAKALEVGKKAVEQAGNQEAES